MQKSARVGAIKRLTTRRDIVGVNANGAYINYPSQKICLKKRVPHCAEGFLCNTPVFYKQGVALTIDLGNLTTIHNLMKSKRPPVLAASLHHGES